MLIASVLLAALQPEPSLRQLIAPCAAQDVHPTTIEAIIASGESWLGRCVSVSGRTAGRILQAPAGSATRIAVDNIEALGIALPANEDVAVTLVGRLDSCGRRARAIHAEMRRSPGIIILAGGACHHTSGPVLVATDGRRVD